MRHWTQDSAHVAALSSITAGGLGVVLTASWVATVFAVAGLVLLGVLRALETRDGWRQATDALAKVEAHEARLVKVEKEAEEARKRAVSAQVAATSRGAMQRQDF